MKIAHLADVHLGYLQYGLVDRFNDFAACWLDACDAICTVRPDICILAGDLFHNRQISPETLSIAISGLTKLQEYGIIVFAVEGNHEQPRTANETGWMEFLNDEGYLRLLNWPVHGFDRWNGYYLYGLPWMGHATNRILSELFDNNAYVGKDSILVLHAGYEGIGVGNYEGTITEDVMAMLKEKFTYIALGHVHKPYSDGTVFNPGSLETCSATEAQWYKRGVLFWEDGKEEIYIPRRRPFYRVSYVPDRVDPNGIYDVGTTGIDIEGAFHVIKRRRKTTDKQINLKQINILDLIRTLTDIEPSLILDIKAMALGKESPERIVGKL